MKPTPRSRKENEPVSTAQKEPPKQRKTQKDYSRDYRQRLKTRHAEYTLFKELEKHRHREYREKMTPEAIERNRGLQRIRQNRYREKLKEEQRDTAPAKRTRKVVKESRQKNTERKRLERANMSQQKRTAVNKKRREAYAAKKQSKMAPTCSPDLPPLPSTSPSVPVSIDNAAMRTAKSRFKKAFLKSLPGNCVARAEVVSAAIGALTPHTKKAVNEKLGTMSPKAKRKLDLDSKIADAIKAKLVASKTKRSVKAMRLRRVMAKPVVDQCKYAARHLGVSRKLSKRVRGPNWQDNRNRRKDATPEATVKGVQEFFTSSGISHDLPDARAAVMVNGTIKPRKIMECSLKSAYDNYVEEHAGADKVSFSVFKKLRPSHVLLFTAHKFRECLCEYCVNIQLKVKSINSHLSSYTHLRIQDQYHASRITLCPRQPGEEYKSSCLKRSCTACGTRLLQEHLQPALHDTELKCAKATWSQWENVPINSTATRMMQVTKESTFEGMVEALQEALSTFSSHLFNAKWQWQQYNSVSKEVPDEAVVFCMDFAENFTCRPQDAPQGCHWTNTQVTIHPVVASYSCKECPRDEAKVVTDSIVFISSDLKHDYHAVQHFIGKSVELLMAEELNFNRIISFSDGAPTQYKNRINFVDCSHAKEDFGVESERHFFGSRHGKGPCDREIGVIKKSVNRAVAASQVQISSPREFYDACCQRLVLPRQGTDHSHTKRRFLFVTPEDIERERPCRTQTKRLANTQKIHCVKGVQPFVVSVRERSCFCQGCRGNGPCSKSDVTGKWTVTELKPPKRQNKQKNRASTAVTPATEVVQAELQRFTSITSAYISERSVSSFHNHP